ncbi:hypothetical protein FGM00_07495 [Aggregatimonas sangjinii]|uniref:Exo-alpha-sialidase n=1 Tax=Aggregatimonas sangjinii TaxID=2583587 RepID=A0A5B7SZ27_9FLAO|nr:hypothetical protein FGM00_07495 [Aggregatimonas sangjinii]
MLSVLLISCVEHPKKASQEKELEAPVVVGMPIGTNSSLPFLFSNGAQTLLSFVEQKGDSMAVLHYTAWINGEWQPPKEILRGSDWFVNWADLPMIAENKGTLWSHVLQKSAADTYSYDIKMNILTEGNKEWQTDIALHTDKTPTEHGFISVLPYQDGLFVTWLDGRNTLENELGERGAMTLRAAELSAQGLISAESKLDARVCDCCSTTAAVTAKGLVVLYRDRSEDEIRDIGIVRQINGKWTTPQIIHNDGWQIKGCPVNGPKAAALGNTLAVAWFTGARKSPRVQLAFSGDGGAHFDAPISVAGASSLGRVDVAVLDADTALISWMETHDRQAQLKAARVSRRGMHLVPKVITVMDASRASGFPQMQVVGENIHFAWTDITDENTQVRVTTVPVADF